VRCASRRTGVAKIGHYGGGDNIQQRRETVNNMDAAEHWRAWLDRYGADYATDEERRAAYRDFKANLARLTEMFSAGEDQDNP
jgi:hypothetical protein